MLIKGSYLKVMISITLLIHGCRLILCALVTASLSGYAFEEEMLKRIIFQPDPDRLVSVAQAAQASRHGFFKIVFYFAFQRILFYTNILSEFSKLKAQPNALILLVNIIEK